MSERQLEKKFHAVDKVSQMEWGGWWVMMVWFG